MPGQGKDQAAFQRDDLVCRQHAVAYTGYDDPRQPGATQPAASPPAPAVPPPDDADIDDTAYLQCMAARGDTIRQEPLAGPPPASGYAYPYAVLGAGLAFGGWHHGGWHHGGWHHGGSSHGWGGHFAGGGHWVGGHSGGHMGGGRH